MNRFITIITCITLLSLFSCESDSDRRETSSSFLTNKRVNFTLNLNLPQFAPLTIAGNSLFLRDTNNFIEGVYISTANAIDYTVFELAEPNNPIGSCSVPTEITGLDLVYRCGEEESKYDIINGLNRANAQLFPLRRYRATRSGSTLNISF